MELSWPAPDTGADAPAREMGQSQWIKRIRHGDAEDSTCTDPYHVYTDVYEEDKAKRGRFRTCVKYSTDPVLEANVSRLYQEIIIPHLIEQYIKETGDTRMRDLLPPGRRRASEDPAGER